MSTATQTRATKQEIAAARARRMELQQKQLAEARTRELITPEGAGLHLKLASASERAGAFMIDAVIICIVFFGGIWLIALTAGQFGYGGLQVAGALIFLLFFLLRNFYWVLFELGRKAATPGKRILGLRVAARNGGQLTANAVLARNFLREIEVFLPLGFLFGSLGADEPVAAWISLLGLVWAGIFLFFPVFNRDKLRAGDLIAGTWVIHAPKTKLMRDIAAGPKTSEHFIFTPEQVDAYGIHELQTLETVLRKSSSDLRADVAGRIRDKIGWTAQPGESDMDFLKAYYAALRQRLEQRMLFGKRKANKYDES